MPSMTLFLSIFTSLLPHAAPTVGCVSVEKASLRKRSTRQLLPTEHRRVRTSHRKEHRTSRSSKQDDLEIDLRVKDRVT